MQPEVCSNIASAPAAVFHRADAARHCLLHSLCVVPLWLPAVSRQAPVAVVEVLQPDPQPNFELLCEQVWGLIGCPVVLAALGPACLLRC